MNSYFKMNRDYRECYLQRDMSPDDKRYQKYLEGFQSSYPNNVTYKDFFMFLIHPVLTY